MSEQTPVGTCETCQRWQPIETASSVQGNHRMVILHHPFNQRGPVDYGFWNTATTRWEVQTMGGWVPFTDYTDGQQPTHWMLPTPPSSTAKE